MNGIATGLDIPFLCLEQFSLQAAYGFKEQEIQQDHCASQKSHEDTDP